MNGRSIDPRLARLAVALAFVGGYVDAVGFVALAQVFTGHITGNTVMLAIDFAEGTWTGVIKRLLAIVMFLAGMVLGAVLDTQIVERGIRSRFAVVFSVEAALLTPLVLGDRAMVSGAAQLARPGWTLYALVALAAIALGLQNGTLRKVGHATVHTTYISGMVTALTEGVIDRWMRRGRMRNQSSTPAPANAAAPDRAKLVMLTAITIAFTAGALVGVALYVWRGFASLLVPLALLLVMAAVDARRPLAG